jgi:proteasome lid subunit RPN8/RPN11
VAGEVERLPGRHAQGVALLLEQQGEALRWGNAAEVAQATEALEQYLEASTAAEAAARRAFASSLAKRRAPEIGETRPGPSGVVTAQVSPRSALAAAPYRYVIGSSTLAEAYGFLVQHLPGSRSEPEFMLAVTGVVVDGVRTLERLIEVPMDHQSFGKASFDMQAFNKIANLLYEHDQHLHAVFHSHRFSGPPAPSGTDKRLQTTLEEGYPAIQAVFSEDGYVRFFANQRPFAIEIHGKGVTPVDGQPNTFRITQFGTLPHASPAAAARGRGDGVRPISAHSGR